MKKENKHIYSLQLTECQARLLSYACDQFMRCIEGQGNAYQDLFEAAWEKRCKEAVGGHGMDKEWDGGWFKMREDAEDFCRQIKRRFWNMESNAHYGIGYDKTADIIWDVHRVIRHQLWLDNPDRSNITVDSENPTSSIGTEPLAVIERTDKPTPKELTKDVAELYADIDNCIMDLIHARASQNDVEVANVQHRMESLMVATQQELQVINDYLTNNK